MKVDRVSAKALDKPAPAGQYVVYATPLDGRGRAYRIKGQPKGMTYVQAHDFGQTYSKTYDVAVDIIYKGAK